MSDLKNYFMQPRSMKCGLNVYPIKIIEYEKFKKLAAKYIILNIKQLNNHRKQNKLQELQVDELYDYIILLIENNENYKLLLNHINKLNELNEKQREEILNNIGYLRDVMLNKNVIEKNINQYSHEEFCELIELSVRKKVIYNPQLKSFEIYSDDNELESVINKLNFNEFREIVMNQNLLYEPIIAPTKQAQKYIDAKLSNTNGVESDLEAIVAFVCTNSMSMDISNYTYYRMMADFYSLMKQLSRSDMICYRAGGMTQKNGKPLDIPNIIDKLGINNNPYENIFKEVNTE